MGLLDSGLSIVYIFAGGKKLLDYYTGNSETLKQFAQYATVQLLRPFGVEINAESCMLLCGSLELVFGSLMLVGPPPLQRLSCKGLMSIMATATYTLVALKQWPHAFIPASFFVGLFFVHQNLSLTTKSRQNKRK